MDSIQWSRSKSAHLKRLLRTGDQANRRRSWRDAEKAYQAALSLDPSLKHIWVQYGHALKEQGDLAGAEAAYQRSLTLDAGLADTHLQLGHVLKLQGRRDYAVDAYVTAYRLDPRNPYPRIELDALGMEMPESAAQPTEFAEDPGFIEAVYGEKQQLALCDTRYVSAQHALSAFGLSSEILRIFDFRYYFYANEEVRAALGRPDVHRCLLHFCTEGLGKCLQINPDLLFDPRFYCATYVEWQLSLNNAYWHWINVGTKRGWHPNRESWVKEQLGPDVGLLRDFDFETCKAFFYPDEDGKWTAQFARFVDSEVLLPGPHLPVRAATADLFTAIGDRFARAGKDEEAGIIYQRVLEQLPNDETAMSHFADTLLRRANFVQTKAIHQAAIDRGQLSIWRFLHLATCYETLGDHKGALKSLHEGKEAFPQDAALRKRFESISEDFLELEWQIAIALARQERISEAQQRLQHACDWLQPLMEPKCHAPGRPIRSIAIVGDTGLAQCYHYRIEQKIEQLRALGYEVVFYGFGADLPTFLSEIIQFQAVIFCRVPAWVPVVRVILKARELGLTTFYDMDDLIYRGGEYPGPFTGFFDKIPKEEY